MNFVLRALFTIFLSTSLSSTVLGANDARTASKKSVKVLTEPATQKPSDFTEDSAIELESATPQVQKPLPAPTQAYEKKWIAAYDLSPIGLVLPIKHGPTVGYRHDETWTFEASYFGGSLSFPLFGLFDLGSISEYHWLLNARRFQGGSFNWVFGLSRHSYEVRLGNAILSRITSNSIPSDILTVHLLGAQVGLGNQWSWENGFLFGVDWFVLEIPVATLKAEAPALDFISNSNDRNTVEDALSILKRLPTGAFLKVRLGYSF